MKRPLLMTIVTASLTLRTLAGPSAQAQNSMSYTAPEGLQVTVLVYNHAGIEQATLLGSEKVAGNIYQQSGVDIVWMNCISRAEGESDRCKTASNSHPLDVLVEQQSRALTGETYGVAYVGQNGRGTVCDVFYDRILEARNAGLASEETILGMVLAHEIGHLLLGLNSHSSAGLMRAQWHLKDFLRGEFEPAFSHAQIQTIRQRLAEATPVQLARR